VEYQFNLKSFSWISIEHGMLSDMCHASDGTDNFLAWSGIQILDCLISSTFPVGLLLKLAGFLPTLKWLTLYAHISESEGRTSISHRADDTASGQLSVFIIV